MEANIPAVQFTNLFTQDPLAEPFWNYVLGEEAFKELKPRFVTMGKNAALATPLSDMVDKRSPQLETYTPQGERQEKIIYHPYYETLKKLSYGAGIIKLKYDPEFLKTYKSVRHRVGYGIGFYFSQTEMGLYCPICMTDGVGWVLEKYGQSAIAQETIKHLSSTNLDELWEGAMFLTERQGGSDVGVCTVTAKETDGRWYLNGDKWFCSNVDAAAILALGRMPGYDTSSATKGLGLFLVLRKKPEHNEQTIRIHRIKDKLGVRSMATGEITFENTQAFPIGGADQGFKQMTNMLNMSRIYNSVSSVSVLRRALLEALAYGAGRKAFGQPLRELPVWRSVIADVVAETLAAQFLLFSAIEHFDRADGGEEHSFKMIRLLTPMTKAITAKLVVSGVSECMESVGGNAYIEESIFPRLLRDGQVLSIWEGTTNILSLDVLRVLKKYGSEFYFSDLENTLSAVKAADKKSQIDHLRGRLETEQGHIREILTLPLPQQQRGLRQWMETAARSYSLVQLLKACQNHGLHDVATAAFDRLSCRSSVSMMFGTTNAQSLASTEEVLLRACYREVSPSPT